MGFEQIKVEYIDHMGDDTRVVDAARVSFDKKSDGTAPEKDSKLIKYLAKHGHFTPFTHCVITLRETVPIFVARQRFKHTVGFSYNEVSRRYVDATPEFYIPDQWRKYPEGSVKQGSGDVVTGRSSDIVSEQYKIFMEEAKLLYEVLTQTYDVAPEMARMILPQSLMTSYYVTGSLAAFARAYNLRSDAHSQLEIQHLASLWQDVIKPLFPQSWEALTGGDNA